VAALAATGAWAFLALPAIAYLALPPGVESSLQIETRQLAYLVLVERASSQSWAAHWLHSMAGCGQRCRSPPSRSPPRSR
jgi:hypothetical protein